MKTAKIPKARPVGRPPETLDPVQVRSLRRLALEVEQAERNIRLRRTRFRRHVQSLIDRGESPAAIARAVGMHRQSIYKITDHD